MNIGTSMNIHSSDFTWDLWDAYLPVVKTVLKPAGWHYHQTTSIVKEVSKSLHILLSQVYVGVLPKKNKKESQWSKGLYQQAPIITCAITSCDQISDARFVCALLSTSDGLSKVGPKTVAKLWSDILLIGSFSATLEKRILLFSKSNIYFYYSLVQKQSIFFFRHILLYKICQGYLMCLWHFT